VVYLLPVFAKDKPLMRIAIISKAAHLGGGGSKVATTLATLLRRDGHFCHHFRRDKEYGYSEDESCVYGPRENLAKYWNHRLRAIGFQEFIPWEYAYLKSELRRMEIDIVHIHDTTTAISPITIAKLARHFPIVWTMHDFSPFTGGCINPLLCDRFKQECGQCPQKGRWPLQGKFDLTSFYLKIKKRIHKKTIIFVAPSQFLSKKAISAGIVEQKIIIVNNSVDTQTFYPLDKADSRVNLGLAADKFTVLLLSFQISDPFKGIDDSIKILEGMPKDIQVIVVGRITNSEKLLFSGLDCTFTGYIEDMDKLNHCYNAADIFLNCSKADNFPLVVLESLAAGTPVYGYQTGGIPEMIETQMNGCLVPVGEWQNLQAKIIDRLNKPIKGEVESCRELAIERFSEKRFLANSLTVYQKAIKLWHN
jgi:glycosyltransferase involved in cell wall biosynthesis